MNNNQNRQNVVGFIGETKIFNKIKPSTLVIRPDSFTFYIGLGKHQLFSYQVVSITPEPNAIRIVHTSRKCPENILFISKQRSSSLISKIGDLGFIPSGDSSEIPEREGAAISWKAPLIFLMLQITPILLFIASKYSKMEILNFNIKNAAWVYFIIFFIQFILCIFIKLLLPLQVIFLKEGRLLEESAEYFNGIALVSIVFLIIILITKSNFVYSEIVIVTLIPSVLLLVNFLHRLRALISDRI